MNSLENFRKDLDEVDAQLINVLARRLNICDQVAQFKKIHHIPMMQPHRVEYVKQRCATLAASHGLDTDFIMRLYTLIIDEACRLEDKIINSSQESTLQVSTSKQETKS
ncbi:hypothetical protein BZZ01_09775 [Nostocales cyanobacterium HT-58-2]|nr:hypothetical protein BZZ01_09775 [Nostocales cyanobacterium HT-58-2]